MGFLTDTTLCIGCKACEVACKQWNQLPADGLELTGNSYDNTRRPRRDHLAPRRLRRAACRRRRAARRHDRAAVPERLADDERRLQALRPRRLPGGLPDRRDHPHRVRHRRASSRTSATAAATACRPARSASRAQPDRRQGAQVHALLRPPEGRPGAGLRQGLPDRSIHSARSTN